MDFIMMDPTRKRKEWGTKREDQILLIGEWRARAIYDLSILHMANTQTTVNTFSFSLQVGHKHLNTLS